MIAMTTSNSTRVNAVRRWFMIWSSVGLICPLRGTRIERIRVAE
jgi:hypothetical protein